MPPFGYPPTCPYHHEIEISALKRKIRLLSETCDAKDLRLKEMVEALSQIVAEVKKYAYHPSLEHMGPLVLDSESVLQKYHEQEAANAK